MLKYLYQQLRRFAITLGLIYAEPQPLYATLCRRIAAREKRAGVIR